MSILGMGTIEILLILLVAFITLGPERMMDAARLLGKTAREARRLTESLSEVTIDGGLADPPNKRHDDHNPDMCGEGSDFAQTSNGEPRVSRGPIAFRRHAPSEGEGANENPQQDKT